MKEYFSDLENIPIKVVEGAKELVKSSKFKELRF